MTDEPTDAEPEVSVVVPLYNEEPNLRPLCAEIAGVMEEEGLDYELILVDDGSGDDTARVARRVVEGNPCATFIELRRNYGQSAAMACGFDHARGEVVVPIDGDRQNDPADIPRLIDELAEGYEVVSGWRKDRKDSLLRRLPSRVANGLISLITGVKLHDYGCTLKAYRRTILDELTIYGETHRFIPALVKWAGGSVGELEVNHRPRTAGESKYGLGRTGRVLMDLLTVKFLMDYLTTPLYLFGKVGFFSFLLALTSLAVVILQKVGNGTNMTGNPLLYLSVMLTILSVQFVSMGLMMELLTRTYHESQQRKTYAVERIREGDTD